MSSITLIGAGGKMGMRLARNLRASSHQVNFVENDPERRKVVEQSFGVRCAELDVVRDSEVVVLAVPDNAIGKVSAAVAPLLSSGSMLIVLDGAAPYAGHMPDRPDLSYFIAHPCHPSMFNWEANEAAAADTFGGSGAKQAIVCALMQGPEEHFALGAEIASTFYAPVTKVHRVTVEQMAILEPVLSETITATFLTMIRQAMDEAEKLGVPLEVSRDFLLGHIYSEAAVIFEQIKGVQMSDGCLKAIDAAIPVIINPDWKRVFEPSAIRRSIADITES